MAVTRGPEPALAGGPGLVAGKDTLAKGALRTWDAIAISVSVLAPGMAMLLNVPGVALVAGGSTPLAFLLGGIGILALAFVIIGFTRRMASAGYAYTYASRSIGKEGGFVAGWLYAFGLACFVPMTMAGVAGLFINLLGLDTKYWFLFFLVGMALLVALSIIRIKVTTSVQLLVGAVTVAIIVIVDLVVVGKGGHSGNTLQPFTFGHTVSGEIMSTGGSGGLSAGQVAAPSPLVLEEMPASAYPSPRRLVRGIDGGSLVVGSGFARHAVALLPQDRDRLCGLRLGRYRHSNVQLRRGHADFAGSPTAASKGTQFVQQSRFVLRTTPTSTDRAGTGFFVQAKPSSSPRRLIPRKTRPRVGGRRRLGSIRQVEAIRRPPRPLSGVGGLPLRHGPRPLYARAKRRERRLIERSAPRSTA